MNHTAGLVAIVLLLMLLGQQQTSVRARQALMLAASYFLYSSWGIEFLLALILSTLINYACGHALRLKRTAARLWIGVALNLLPLAFFKYLPVLLQSEPVGSWQFDFGRQILMPIGMSFWTFQGLSYLFDIYYEEELDPTLLEFSLYMAFWPTVFSGPVCRLPDMLPQFRRLPAFNSDDLSAGMLRVIQGIVMKFALAALLASGWQAGEGITSGFDRMKDGWGGVDVWMLGIGYGFLLFFDFAGYSHMVIGSARMFGIRLPENFDRPFLSVTPSVFWTRWHMSLSFWIRDYVYNPLAVAGRRFSWWPYAGLIVSMTLFGLWHGAKWTYIAYGVFHGVVLVMHRVGQKLKRSIPFAVPRTIGTLLSWGATFALVTIGFILFRANDLAQAWIMVRTLLTPSAYGHFAMARSFYLLTTAMAVGYFAVIAGQEILANWRARYAEAANNGYPSGYWWQPASTVILAAGGVFDFLARTLWWWLGPGLFSIGFFVGLVMYTKKAVIAVTPFVYTLF